MLSPGAKWSRSGCVGTAASQYFSGCLRRTCSNFWRSQLETPQPVQELTFPLTVTFTYYSYCFLPWLSRWHPLTLLPNAISALGFLNVCGACLPTYFYCSETGYTYKFEVYAGKRLTKTNNGLGYDVVMNLMNGMFRQGYHLFVDNFYSSPRLFSDLYDKGCMATGTVRENRKGFPSGLANSMIKKEVRGSIRWFRKENLVFLKWRDTKDVCALSTSYAVGRTGLKEKQK